MKTLLICHEDAPLDREVLARWLASFSDLVGLIILEERPQRRWNRIKREISRVGPIRFLDVLAFRLYYKLRLGPRDKEWECETVTRLCDVYRKLADDTPILRTHSPNSSQAEQFLREAQPDIVIARCKAILKPSVYSIARDGTFVMHPGVCPEYRNAHGCFWALAERDYSRVGMTLLRIDAGVDTGPVYGYFSYPYDASRESHIVIQHRVVLENLDRIREALVAIHEHRAVPIDTAGRRSRAWGQPWLTRYLRIRSEAKRQL